MTNSDCSLILYKRYLVVEDKRHITYALVYAADT